MQAFDEDRGRTPAERILDEIAASQAEFKNYNAFCDKIDRIYSDRNDVQDWLDIAGFTDREYDLFWSSMEVLKPAIYAKPPAVVVKPRFSDANATDKLTAELIERVINSEFERGDINDAMLNVRDDLALLNRGVAWATLDDSDGNAVCVDWLDREDFVHEIARTWADVNWVARRAWLTLEQMKERFGPRSDDVYLKAFFGPRDDRRADPLMGYETGEIPDKAAVWEVWDRREKKVRWVAEGVDEFLDEDEPHLNLKGYFPCPKPAYGTLIRRTLIPMPDYKRYAVHLNQINSLTKRIYDLLDRIRVKGFVAAGGDIGEAVQTALADEDASAIIIPVPGASLTATGGAANMVAWLPLDMIAQTIQGMIEARAQLFADFDRLSGISDIMRGETEAEETLGAQRMKGQYGSVRVRDKKDELIRLARDMARITGEIVCEKFTKEELLQIAQMDIPTRREVEKSIRELEKAAREEMEKLRESLPEQPPEDPQQQQAIQQQLQQAQQQLAGKYGPQFQELSKAVVIEDVMKLVRDDRARGLIIDVETDSTVMTDELAEKQARSEFLTSFSGAIAAVQPLMAAGESGAKLAGAMLKFALQPYSTNRELDATIDEFVENAPQIAAAMAPQEDNTSEELLEAQKMLGEAEQQKAQAQTMKAQADAARDQAELQRKMVEMQIKAQGDEQKFMLDAEKLRQSAEANAIKAEEAQAKVDNLRAATIKLLAEAGVAVDAQALDEFKSLAEIDFRAQSEARADVDAEMRIVDSERSNARAERGEDRADRQQDFSERAGE